MLNRSFDPFRLAALPLLLCALACGGVEESGPTPDSNVSSAAPAGPAAPASVTAVIFETRTIERKDDAASASFSFPVITAAPSKALQVALTREIDQFLVGDSKRAETPEEAADEFLAEARSTRQEFPDAVPWVLSRKAEIAYQDAKVVSLRLTEDAYAGGAHGLTTVHYASFEPKAGRRLGLSDLVTPEGEARLAELGERELRKVQQIPREQNLTDAGFTFEGGVFTLSEEIAVLADGLVIHYNPYEIAAYAMGPTEIIISRSELAPIAKPGGPLN